MEAAEVAKREVEEAQKLEEDLKAKQAALEAAMREEEEKRKEEEQLKAG